MYLSLEELQVGKLYMLTNDQWVRNNYDGRGEHIGDAHAGEPIMILGKRWEERCPWVNVLTAEGIIGWVTYSHWWREVPGC